LLVSRPFYERELSSALLYPPVRAMANEGGGGEKESGGGGPAVVIDEEPFGRSVDAPCRLGRRTRSLGERELLAWAHRLPTGPERESSRASLAHLFIFLASAERWRKLRAPRSWPTGEQMTPRSKLLSDCRDKKDGLEDVGGGAGLEDVGGTGGKAAPDAEKKERTADALARRCGRGGVGRPNASSSSRQRGMT